MAKKKKISPSFPSSRGANPMYGDGSQSADSKYKMLLDRVSKERGLSPKAVDDALNKVAYHESATTMNPKLKQYGGGPGRGLFQFEYDSLKTALRRGKNYYGRTGEKLDMPTPMNYDATNISADEQKRLALLDMLERPNFNLGKAIQGGDKLTQQWGRGWQTTRDPKKMKNFSEHAKMYDDKKIREAKNVIPSTIQDMWNKKYKFGSQGLDSDYNEAAPMMNQNPFVRDFKEWQHIDTPLIPPGGDLNMKWIEETSTAPDGTPVHRLRKAPKGGFTGFGGGRAGKPGGGGKLHAKFEPTITSYGGGKGGGGNGLFGGGGFLGLGNLFGGGGGGPELRNGSQAIRKYQYGTQGTPMGYMKYDLPEYNRAENLFSSTMGTTSLGIGQNLGQTFFGDKGGIAGSIGDVGVGLFAGAQSNRNMARDVEAKRLSNKVVDRFKFDQGEYVAMNRKGNQSVKRYEFGSSNVSGIQGLMQAVPKGIGIIDPMSGYYLGQTMENMTGGMFQADPNDVANFAKTKQAGYTPEMSQSRLPQSNTTREAPILQSVPEAKDGRFRIAGKMNSLSPKVGRMTMDGSTKIEYESNEPVMTRNKKTGKFTYQKM
jgi:hypothetical protein